MDNAAAKGRPAGAPTWRRQKQDSPLATAIQKRRPRARSQLRRRGPPGSIARSGTPEAAAQQVASGRFPDGFDADSNCADFQTQIATALSAATGAGANNIKVGSVAGFEVGQKIVIDFGANLETVVIETVVTLGATTVGMATNAGATVIPVASGFGFSAGQTIVIDRGANQESAVAASVTGGGRGGGGARITVTAQLKSAHAAGAHVSGSGITLATALTKAHDIGA